MTVLYSASTRELLLPVSPGMPNATEDATEKHDSDETVPVPMSVDGEYFMASTQQRKHGLCFPAHMQL